ncbi:MAG: hypothetical protein WD670_02535, partial [Actinomycetota bacterium]
MSVEAPTDPLSLGEEALRTGDWAGARSTFEAILADGGGPEAHDGLGRALWWLGDLEGALDHRERAYVAFRKGGEAARAAGIA